MRQSILLLFSVLFILQISPVRLVGQSAKGQSIRMHTIPLTRKKTGGGSSESKPIIAFLNPVGYEQSTKETQLAFNFLKSIPDFDSEYMTYHDFLKKARQSEKSLLVWMHCPENSSAPDSGMDIRLISLLKKYVDNGGRIFLTNRAVHYLNIIGFESVSLSDSIKLCKDEGYGRRLGIHSFRNHPVFAGLNEGTYLLRPAVDITTRITGMFGKTIPHEGQVVAVDWDYIFLREDSKLVFEYHPGKGHVLAIGGYINFSVSNTNRAQLEKFTQNCIRYLSKDNRDNKCRYWNYSPRLVEACLPDHDSVEIPFSITSSNKWNLPSSELALNRRYATDNFWDVAGERMLTMGTEKANIEEIWAHPFMAFRDYEVGIRFEYKDTILWLCDEKPEIEVYPAFLKRQYKFSRGYLTEIIVNDPTECTGVIHYEYRGVYGAELIMKVKSNLRWMWPYSENVTGSICYSWNEQYNAYIFQDYSRDLNAIIGASRKPVQHVAGQFDGFSNLQREGRIKGDTTSKIQVAALFCYKLGINDNMDMVFSASSEGNVTTLGHFKKTLANPGMVLTRAIEHCDNLLTNSLMITTPDQNFNTGYRWSILSTDRFYVHTPGMGKALVAGYSTTCHGWDGGHTVNGRPGYGWYFGRDAEWSSFALLDYGAFDQVKSQLEFFQRFQDLNGKIFHETSTSGFIHYDAADATPLYLVLAGRYFRHTNDTGFIRSSWPSIKRAMDFCFSTDTDKDHLIENTNVGHGWVEGGELYGSHSTIYMAGIWGAALREIAGIADFMHNPEADHLRFESQIQEQIINNNFWNEGGQFYAYGKNQDGSFRFDQTILPSVPVLFGMTETEKSISMLKSVASNAFTTNWGVRILREDSKWFKPTGYHYGSVWPLFTGWASLADYKIGNAVQGYSHLMNNLSGYKSWALGFIQEVYNGANFQPSGVCAHQCWSETMVIQPTIEGMLGMVIDAPNNQIQLSPSFPPQWDSVQVQNIRMAGQLVEFGFMRDNSIARFNFKTGSGSQIHIVFMPQFPAGTIIKNVTENGRSIPFTSFKTSRGTSLFLKFDLQSVFNLIVETQGGISVLPIESDLKPGILAEGPRILSATLSGSKYEVETEGLAGSSAAFAFWSADPVKVLSEQARIMSQNSHITTIMIDFDKSADKYTSKVIALDIK